MKKKKAISLVAIIVSMAILLSIMIMSMTITARLKHHIEPESVLSKQGGAFLCYFDKNDGSLKSRIKYSKNDSYKENDGCSFIVPKDVANIKLTLIGGFGGGATMGKLGINSSGKCTLGNGANCKLPATKLSVDKLYIDDTTLVPKNTNPPECISDEMSFKEFVKNNIKNVEEEQVEFVATMLKQNLNNSDFYSFITKDKYYASLDDKNMFDDNLSFSDPIAYIHELNDENADETEPESDNTDKQCCPFTIGTKCVTLQLASPEMNISYQHNSWTWGIVNEKDYKTPPSFYVYREYIDLYKTTNGERPQIKTYKLPVQAGNIVNISEDNFDSASSHCGEPDYAGCDTSLIINGLYFKANGGAAGKREHWQKKAAEYNDLNFQKNDYFSYGSQITNDKIHNYEDRPLTQYCLTEAEIGNNVLAKNDVEICAGQGERSTIEITDNNNKPSGLCLITAQRKSPNNQSFDGLISTVCGNNRVVKPTYDDDDEHVATPGSKGAIIIEW